MLKKEFVDTKLKQGTTGVRLSGNLSDREYSHALTTLYSKHPLATESPPCRTKEDCLHSLGKYLTGSPQYGKNEIDGGSVYESVTTEEAVLPVIFGKLSGGADYVVEDIQDGVLIVGNTGTGKTSIVNNIVDNIVRVTTPEEHQVILYDVKYNHLPDKGLNTYPHVVGIHGVDTEELYELLNELCEELNSRKDYLYSRGYDNYLDYVKYIKSKGERLQFPLLTVVFEEATTQLTMLKLVDEDKYADVLNLMQRLTDEGKDLGVTLISVHTGNNVPAEFVGNNTIRIVFSPEKEVSQELLNIGVSDPTNLERYTFYIQHGSTGGLYLLNYAREEVGSYEQQFMLSRVIGYDILRRNPDLHGQLQGQLSKLDRNRNKLSKLPEQIAELDYGVNLNLHELL